MLEFWLIILGAFGWVILIWWYRDWKNTRPVVVPTDEWITAYQQANSRLGRKLDGGDRALLKAYSKLRRSFENPYAAAIHGKVEFWSAFTEYGRERSARTIPGFGNPFLSDPRDPVTERIESEQQLGLHAICEFVIEGHLPREEGKRYHNKLAEIWRTFLSRNQHPPNELTTFESMLESQLGKASSPSAGPPGTVPP